jgi:hypothetical protein
MLCYNADCHCAECRILFTYYYAECHSFLPISISILQTFTVFCQFLQVCANFYSFLPPIFTVFCQLLQLFTANFYSFVPTFKAFYCKLLQFCATFYSFVPTFTSFYCLNQLLPAFKTLTRYH